LNPSDFGRTRIGTKFASSTGYLKMCRTFQQQNIQKHVLPINLLTVENALSINNFKLNRRN